MTTTITRLGATTTLATPGALAQFAAILRPRTGQRMWVDSIHDELMAAGITGQAVGYCFHTAYERGWLHGTDEMRRSTNPDARGRRVAVWIVAGVPGVVG